MFAAPQQIKFEPCCFLPAPGHSEEPPKAADEPQSGLVDPVALLFEELRHDDFTVRLNATKGISLLAGAIGAVRTIDEVLPFLQQFSSNEEDDDVLLGLIGQLELLLDVVGRGNASCLLLLVEELVGCEDSATREAALSFLGGVLLRALKEEEVSSLVVPMGMRLAGHEWFPRRQSASQVLLLCSQHLNGGTVGEDCLDAYISLIHDSIPMVRKVAAGHFSKLVSLVHVGNTLFLERCHEAVQFIMQDEIDAIRLLSIEPLIALAQMTHQSEALEEAWMPLLAADLKSQTLEDKSWRTKYFLLEKFPAVYQLFSGYFSRAEDAPFDLVQLFKRLAADSEPEVRSNAANVFPAFLQALCRCGDSSGSSGCKELVELLHPMATDSSVHVREAFSRRFAEICLSLVSAVPAAALSDLLLGEAALLLGDESSSSVRLNLITDLPTLISALGTEVVWESLGAALAKLAQDRQWRVRYALVDCYAVIGRSLGRQYVDLHLLPLLARSLSDHTFAVRDRAITAATQLMQLLGEEWTGRSLLEIINRLTDDSNYLFRETALRACYSIFCTFPTAYTSTALLETLLRAASHDPVPNVRLIALSVIRRFRSEQPHPLPQSLAATVATLAEKDFDSDVREAASSLLSLN